MPDSEPPELPEQPTLNRVTNNDGYTFVGGIERGMIFWGEVLPDETRDSEQFHEARNPCPWIVLSADLVHRKLPIVQAAPLTTKLNKDQQANFRNFRVRLPGAQLLRYRLRSGSVPLEGDSLVLIEQLRVLAHERLLGDPVAKASIQLLGAIEVSLKYVLDMP